MESQPQNPDFRNNPENFQPCMDRHLSHAIRNKYKFLGRCPTEPKQKLAIWKFYVSNGAKMQSWQNTAKPQTHVSIFFVNVQHMLKKI